MGKYDSVGEDVYVSERQRQARGLWKESMQGRSRDCEGICWLPGEDLATTKGRVRYIAYCFLIPLIVAIPWLLHGVIYFPSCGLLWFWRARIVVGSGQLDGVDSSRVEWLLLKNDYHPQLIYI
jgi:hypothetical protein